MAKQAKDKLKIEVLHVANCPHFPQTMENLRNALRELKIESRIVDVVVKDLEDAKRLKFLGSTSIRIDGEDIAPLKTDQYVLT